MTIGESCRAAFGTSRRLCACAMAIGTTAGVTAMAVWWDRNTHSANLQMQQMSAIGQALSLYCAETGAFPSAPLDLERIGIIRKVEDDRWRLEQDGSRYVPTLFSPEIQFSFSNFLVAWGRDSDNATFILTSRRHPWMLNGLSRTLTDQVRAVCGMQSAPK